MDKTLNLRFSETHAVKATSASPFCEMGAQITPFTSPSLQKKKKEAQDCSLDEECHGQPNLSLVERLEAKYRVENRVHQVETAKVRKNSGPKETKKRDEMERGYRKFSVKQRANGSETRKLHGRSVARKVRKQETSWYKQSAELLATQEKTK